MNGVDCTLWVTLPDRGGTSLLASVVRVDQVFRYAREFDLAFLEGEDQMRRCSGGSGCPVCCPQ